MGEEDEEFWPIWAEDGEAPEVGFSHAVFASTILPLRNSKATFYRKTNGRAKLTLRTTPTDDDEPGGEVFLPYGAKARLLLIYAMSEARRTESGVVRIGSSFRDFCARAGIDPSGRNIKTLQEQLYRLSQTYVKIRHPVASNYDDEVRAFLFKKVTLYKDVGGHQQVLWPQELHFHDDITASILRHSFPVDLKALKHISHSARAIDIYLFLVHRLFRLRRPTTIPWSGKNSLLNQFAKEGAHLGSFRGRFREALELVVKRAYPEANLELGKDGLTLRKSPLAIPERPRK